MSWLRKCVKHTETSIYLTEVEHLHNVTANTLNMSPQRVAVESSKPTQPERGAGPNLDERLVKHQKSCPRRLSATFCEFPL